MRQTTYPWLWRYSLRATHERAQFADLAGQRATFAKTVFSEAVIWSARQSDAGSYGRYCPPTCPPRKINGHAGTEPEYACHDHSELTPFANLITEANLETGAVMTSYCLTVVQSNQSAMILEKSGISLP
ncbi:hypothetical protein [Pseudomonas migulae]|uniref:hypothetical protein n=1 Tax=Pseudomonas migulae TaxID=78543 RepID=UPI001356331D|nr:hypothetical protein [Pseudomonas migulae]